MVVVVKNEWGEIEGVVGPFTEWDDATGWALSTAPGRGAKSTQFIPLFSPEEPYGEGEDG